MPPSFDSLQPQRIWYWFGELCRVPRASGDESAASELVVDFARELGLRWKRDESGNVMIYKPGAGLASDSLPIAVQAHLDMVAEKAAGSSHDFASDPIAPEVEGDWVTAKETTLGADNGIGVALMMALLEDDDAQHPPLECLFTVDEERGLTGASHLDPSWISARRLINLDSESEGRFCIGCAGGLDILVEMPLSFVQPAGDLSPYALTVGGLKGGHSGMEIGRSRANAIRVMARAVSRLVDSCGVSVVSLAGGTKRNAIPRIASALLMMPSSREAQCVSIVSAVEQERRAEFAGIEPAMEIRLRPFDARPTRVLTPESARRALDLVLALPHGVEKMSGVEPTLVETSDNLATLGFEGDGMVAALTLRSLLEEAKYGLAERILAIARLAGCRAITGGSYPGWRPDPLSPLLRTAALVWKEFSGHDASVETVHAGVECGIIGAAVGGMDMISMGPDIRDVHVPGEKVSVSSTARFWTFFRTLLARL